MKDYKEMADSVFKKIDKYEEKERQRKKAMVRFVSTASVLALFVSGGILWKLSSIEREKFENAAVCLEDGKCMDDSKLTKKMVSSINQEMVEKKEEAGQKEAALEKKSMRKLAAPEDAKEEVMEEKEGLAKKGFENQIVMNIGGDWIAKCNVPQVDLPLKTADMVILDKEGLNQYFKRNIFPKVPSDLKEWEVPSYQIFKKHEGRGETYYDRQVLNYSSSDFKRSVNLEVSTTEGELSCGASPKEGNYQSSLIQGKEVELFEHGEGVLSADFKVEDAFFQVVTTGLNQDEMVEILESLLLK